MDKKVFRTYMKNDVVQKTIIFADAFNLNIDGWRPVNTSEHPYRINFYNGELLVGFIDANMDDIGYVETNMPFTLFTPFGKVTGEFLSYNELFKYSIINRPDIFKNIEGLFGVKKVGEKNSKKYYVTSSLTLEDIENNRIRIDFNSTCTNYKVEIQKTTTSTYETVGLYFGCGYAGIRHSYYPRFNDEQKLAKIEVEVEGKTHLMPVSFNFLDKPAYQRYIKIDDECFSYMPFWKKVGFINFDLIDEEITENDKRMLEFIDEIRNSLTMLANGTTPICIYDKIAQLCFSNKDERLKLAFSRAGEADIALKRNRILKKMDSFEDNNKF